MRILYIEIDHQSERRMKYIYYIVTEEGREGGRKGGGRGRGDI